MPQPFYTTQSQTGRLGVEVPRQKTIGDVKSILSGALDKIPEDKFLYIGSLESAKLISPSPASLPNSPPPSPTPSANNISKTKERDQKSTS